MADVARASKQESTGEGDSNLRAGAISKWTTDAVDTLLARCLFGEARGESDAARRAIAQVILNRARHPHKVFGSRPGATLEENLRRVILQPRAFSCFLETDANYPKILHPLDYEPAAVWQQCLDAARQALSTAGAPDALTLNSDHYFDDSSLQSPSWADPAKHTVQIGRLRFYRLYLPRLAEADAGFLLRTGGKNSSDSGPLAAGDAAATPSRHRRLSVPMTSGPTGSPPEPSCRAAAAPTRVSVGAHAARHRREVSGSGSFASHPAPHRPSQRTPRLGSNRWYQRSRGLSSLGSGFGIRDSGFATRDSASGLGSHGQRISDRGHWPGAKDPR